MNHALLGPTEKRRISLNWFYVFKSSQRQGTERKTHPKNISKSDQRFSTKTVIAEELHTRLQFFWHKQLNILNGRR